MDDSAAVAGVGKAEAIRQAIVDLASPGSRARAAQAMAAAHEMRVDYRGLRLDLADAVGVVLADRYKTDRIFTLDQRDFRAIKPLTKSFDAFRLPPIDPLD